MHYLMLRKWYFLRILLLLCPILLCTIVICNWSNAYFTSVNFFTISPLCFSSLYQASVVRSYHFFATNFASSSVSVSWGMLLCTFILLHCLVVCNIILFLGSVSVSMVSSSIFKSGRFPPYISSCIGTFLSFFIPPFISYVHSFSLVDAFGIVFFYLVFLLVVLPPISLVWYVAFLVFVAGLVDCYEGSNFVCCLDFGTFFEITRTFHYVGQSFISHCTSSPVTQYLNYSHSFLGSLLAWIHMLFPEAWKFSMLWFSLTTSYGILQVFSSFSYISS